MELLEISTRPNRSNIFTTEKKKEAKDLLKLIIEAQKDLADKHSNRKDQTVNNPTFIETISRIRSEKEPMTIRTYKKGNDSSLQYECLDKP